MDKLKRALSISNSTTKNLICTSHGTIPHITFDQYFSQDSENNPMIVYADQMYVHTLEFTHVCCRMNIPCISVFKAEKSLHEVLPFENPIIFSVKDVSNSKLNHSMNEICLNTLGGFKKVKKFST